jgi:EmrB/QacA subfamily drug resistance transporter
MAMSAAEMAGSTELARSTGLAPSNRRWWGLAALSLGLVVVGLDTTVLNVALSTLATDLDASTGDLQWIVDSYVLVLAAMMLPVGALGDRYGRRGGLIAGLLLFGAASAVAAWAGSVGVLIAARAVMGLGAAALATLGIALIPAMFAPHERARAIGVLTVGIFLGLPVGPLVGGYLLDHYWWGSVFLINVPITLAAAAAAVFLLPASRRAAARRPDGLGGVLVGVGLAALVYGIVEAPAYGWGGVRTVAGLGVGVLLLGLFVLVERRVADPMLDLRLFRDARFGWATAAVALVSVALFGLLFVLPQYLQVIAGNDAFGTGLRLLPMIGGLVVGGAASDRVAARFGARPVIAAGMVVLAAGLVVASRVTVSSGYGLLSAGLVVVGLGLGLAMPTAIDVVMGALPEGDTGVGIAVTTALRMVAGALGVALLPSVISSVYTDRVADAAAGSLAGLPPAAADAATTAATDSVAGAAEVARSLGAAGDALRDAAFTAFTDGMSLVLLLCAGVALVAAGLVARLLPGAPASAPPGERGAEERVPVPVG